MYGLCRECFQIGYDDTAPDRQLLLSEHEQECLSCRRQKRVVVAFFKYGECSTSADSTHVVPKVKYLGVNPNYSYWSNESPFRKESTSECMKN